MGLKRATLNLSIINAVSIFLGFIFHILLGRQFGVSRELDCFFAALAIFGILGIFSTFLTSLFIPIFNEIKYKDEKESFIFTDVVIKWSIAFAIIVTLLAWLSGDLTIRAVASGFEKKSIILTLEITRILIVALVFYSISNAIICILNALYHFSLPAITGLLHPILNIAALFVLTPIYGIKAIAISYIVSNILQSCILMIYLMIKTRWRPTMKIYHNKIPSLIKESSKMTISGLIRSLRDIISRNIASHLVPGSITLLAYAEKFIAILHQIAVSPLSKVFYSRVSEWIPTNKWADIRELFDRVVRVNVALVFFLSSGAIVFLVPLLNILFLGSRFTSGDINMLFYLVLIMLIYLVVLSYETYFVQLVYAEKKSNIVGFNAILGVVVFFISAWLFSKIFGIYGIAMSIPLTEIVVCLLFYYFVNKQLQTSLKKFVVRASKGFIISLFFAFSGIIIKNIIENNIVMILFILPIWSIFCILTIKSFMHEEIEFIRIREIFTRG